MKPNIKNIFILFIISFAAVSCGKFLDTEPVNKVPADDYFKNERELEIYANGLLESYTPGATSIALGDKYSDLVATKTSEDFYRPGVYDPSKPGNWGWGSVRRANILISGVAANQSLLPVDAYKHYMGVGHFWRAWFHLGHVRGRSDVPWIDRVLDVKDTLLFSGRQDREFVMHKILEDINFAVENCSSSEKYKFVINKWVALAFKARLCLYEGTYRKYHTVNPSTNKPWNNKYETSEAFLREAVSACEALMESGVFSLNPDFHENFVTSDLTQNMEMIWFREYIGGEINILHDVTWRYNSNTYDQKVTPTKDLVRMFLNADGTYVTNDKVSLTQELLNRDSRLCWTVNHEGWTYRANDGKIKLKPHDCTFGNTGYTFIKWNQEIQENYSKARCDNSIPIFRYAEVLLNYAEAKAELGEMNESIWASTVAELRKRSGITGNLSMPVAADPWLLAYYDIHPENTAYLTPVILEIRRERVTEMILEDLRVEDLKRWRCLEKIVERGTENAGWKGIWVTAEEVKNGIIFNGSKFTFSKAEIGQNNYKYGNSDKDQNITLSEGSYGYMIYHYKLEWKDRNYVYPISLADLTLNPKLGQNYGW